MLNVLLGMFLKEDEVNLQVKKIHWKSAFCKPSDKNHCENALQDFSFGNEAEFRQTIIGKLTNKKSDDNNQINMHDDSFKRKMILHFDIIFIVKVIFL